MQQLEYLKEQMKRKSMIDNAVRTLLFDQSTVCPKGAMEDKNEIIAYLSEQSFSVLHDSKVTEAIMYLYDRKDELDEWDRVLVEQQYRRYLIEKNITTEEAYEFSLNETNAFVEWSKAKEASDYSIFKEPLLAVIKGCQKKAQKRELTKEDAAILKDDYDRLMDIYDRGMTQADLDPLFDECRDRIIALTKKIRESKKQIRTDFLSRHVSIEKQREITEYLMKLQGFDFDRGIFSTSEHGYTERLSANDVRITTHFYEDCFMSSIYTVLHETGHAIFDQRQPAKNNDYFIFEGKTLGMHESVSRFYENILGRSRGYVHLMYPAIKDIIPDVLNDVSEEEFYLAANIVTPSLIRTEADEVTYGLHVILRYELEKEIIAGRLSVDDLPAAWNKKYEEYLGVSPANDREGVLQDVHWTSDFGYFPTYLMGNLYNAMYFNTMKQDLDIDAILASGDIGDINKWMCDHVFAKADRLSPKEWIKDITGRNVCADDFLTYLENKYTEIYEL